MQQHQDSQPARQPAYMLVANDEKVTWDAAGNIHFLAPGKDTLMIFDIGSDPAMPKEIVTLHLSNSVFGPPTNLAVTPDNKLGLLANPMSWTAEGAGWRPGPGDTLFVLDLTLDPPALIDTLIVGRQPSGLSISRDGKLVLIANRADNSVSILTIEDKQVRLIGAVEVGGQPVAVNFSADGKRAFVARMNSHTLGVLHIDGIRVTHDPAEDILTGLVPFNLGVTPDGTLALTVDMGSPNASDGHADTISVIDIASEPPRLIDKVVVADGPEGLVISPTGKHAAAIIVQGSNCAHDAWYYHRNGKVELLRIDGRKVSRCSEIEVGALPEGAVFSADGAYLYVGNFLDCTLSILKIEDDCLLDTGKRISLPGHPAAMRSLSY